MMHMMSQHETRRYDFYSLYKIHATTLMLISILNLDNNVSMLFLYTVVHVDLEWDRGPAVKQMLVATGDLLIREILYIITSQSHQITSVCAAVPS